MMTELQIKTTNFDIAKGKIKEFSNKLPSISLSKFEQKKNFFGINKNITADDLNKFVSELQSNLIISNKVQGDVVKQFGEVYNALESLDKEYIQGIIFSIKAAGKANQEALEAHKEAKEAQVDIKRVLDGLKITVKKLGEFKDNSTHRGLVVDRRIDEIEESILFLEETLEGNLQELGRKAVQNSLPDFGEYKSKQITIDKTVKELRSEVESLIKFRAVIQNYKHFNQIDEIWKDIQAQKSGLVEVEKKFKKYDSRLVEIDSLKSKVNNVKHFSKIDFMWDVFQTNKSVLTELSANLKKYQFEFKQLEQESVNTYNKVRALEQFRAKLDGIVHLDEVDSIWKDLQGHSTDLLEINRNLLGVDLQIKSLLEFRGRLENYAHLSKIDLIWEDIQVNKTQILYLSEQTSSSAQKVVCLEQYKDKLNSLEHLFDIDKVWIESKNHLLAISSLEKEFNELVQKVVSLENYIEKLKRLKHLDDIDETWEEVQNHKTSLDTHASRLAMLESHKEELLSIKHISDIDTMWNDIVIERERGNQTLEKLEEVDVYQKQFKIQTSNEFMELKEQIDATNILFEKKLKYSYFAIVILMIVLLVQFFI